MSKVLFSEPSEFDLDAIEINIGSDLENPIAAINTVNGIIDTAERLSLFPEKHPLVSDNLLAKIGIRMTWYKNYNIFYTYNIETDTVHILRILYNKANWRDILS